MMAGVIVLTTSLGVSAATAAAPASMAPAAAIAETGSSSAATTEDEQGVLPPAAGAAMPTNTNEAVGDVLGLGYEQVIRLNGSKVEIADPGNRGGTVRKSFEAGTSRHYPGSPVFYGSKYFTDDGAVRAIAPMFGWTGVDHAASRLTVLNDSIYVSSLRSRTDGWGKLHPDGSAVRKYDAATGELVNERFILSPADVAVTALGAYEFKGHEYLAIGLNRFGVRVVDTNVDGMPDVRVVHDDWNGRNGLWDRDIVLAVALGTDAQGRFILVSGLMTYEYSAVVAVDLEDGSTRGDRAVHDIWSYNHRNTFDPWQWPDLIRIGPFGAEGKILVAINWPVLPGYPEWSQVSYHDASSGEVFIRVDGGSAQGIRFFTDAQGGNRVAMLRSGSLHGTYGSLGEAGPNGGWYHYDVGADDLHDAVPGYRAWAVTVENRSRAKIALTTHHGATRMDGCWYGSELRGLSRPIPAEPTEIPAGGTAGPFGTAQRTFGEGCASSHPGVLYAQVAPDGAPQETQLVKLLGDKEGVRVDQQVGAGRFTVTAERAGTTGVKLIVTDQHDEPTPVGVPSLTAKRLTPEPASTHKITTSVDDPYRPVYRFTVSGQSWHVPGADQLSNVTLPVPTVEASTDQVTWTALGTTTSPLAPTRDGTEIALGDSTFYWQTAPGATDYRYFRLTLPDGTTSEHLDILPLPAPPVDTLVYGFSIPLTFVAAPRSNGLDRATLPFRLMRLTPYAELDPTTYAELYDRLYYRDDKTLQLITGLGHPSTPGELTTITPLQGQFTNETATAPAYVSTTSKLLDTSRQARAVFKPNGLNTAVKEVAMSMRPDFSTLEARGTASGGLAVVSCAEGACRLPAPTPSQPLLHSADERTISLQLRSSVIAGTLSLPLISHTQQAYPEDVDPVEDALTYPGSKAMLGSAHEFGYNATVTTYLVTHGELVGAENVAVKAKE
jgi:hypothetical protein